MKFFLQVAFIVQNEAAYLLRNPRRLISGALLAFVPALYCVLYIASVWDPDTNTQALPVAVVNLDAGVQYLDHTFNVGWEVATRLEDSKRFGFVMLNDEQAAREQVRKGQLAFAVIIPKDFSAGAVPGAEAGAAKVVVYTSQGNNFETAIIAKHFAAAMGHEINESLNERRWEMVLHSAAGSQRSVDRLHDVVDRLRRDVRRLNEDAGGLQSTAKSAKDLGQLASDVEMLAKALPARPISLEGSAEGLANSVEPVVEVDAPVENSGSGFASNIVPGSLWLGATVAAFLIHIQVLPRHAQMFSNLSKVVGKLFLPACVALLQSLLVFVAVVYILKIHVLMPSAFALTLVVASMSFLCVVFALTKAFGDAGKGVAMCLLAVQLTSSGGILPVELSGGVFAQISPWLPMTWLVESVKASMFGAYGGAWAPPLAWVASVGVASFVFSCGVGRWRFVKFSTRPSQSRT